MEWNLLTCQNLALIDREIENHRFSPAEYEIIRRIVYASCDCEYQSLVVFAHQPLKIGAAALSARVPIIVDSSMIQAGINSALQLTFANPVYCLEEMSQPLSTSPKKAWLLNHLAKRYPEAIYVIGKNQLLLANLLELIQSKQLDPSLIIATPAGFVKKEIVNHRLRDSLVSHIRIDSCKGGVHLAIAIFNGLVDLAWIVQEKTSPTINSNEYS
jgi:precorrin-8X/cobalt-precorrin-8 methylmutase